jgi:hypothetical protein
MASKVLQILYPHVPTSKLVSGSVFDSVRHWVAEDVTKFCIQLTHSSRCETSTALLAMKLVSRFKEMENVKGKVYPHGHLIKDPFTISFAAFLLSDKLLQDNALGLGSWLMIYKACLHQIGRSTQGVSRVFLTELEREFAVFIEHQLHVATDEWDGWMEELSDFDDDLKDASHDILLPSNVSRKFVADDP